MKAVDIIWETDGEDLTDMLPTEMELPDDFEEDDFDRINDYLSDNTGFLVIDYNIVK